MSSLEKANVRNRCAYACYVLAIVFTSGSLFLIYVMSSGEQDGEMLSDHKVR